MGKALLSPEEAPKSEIGDAEVDAIKVEADYTGTIKPSHSRLVKGVCCSQWGHTHTHTGPELKWPLTEDMLINLRKAFKAGQVLHAK